MAKKNPHAVLFQMPDGSEREVTDQADILLLLGRLTEGMSRLSDDFREEKESAAASRRDMSDRLDQVHSDMGSMKHDIDMAAVISSQKLGELSRELKEHKAAVQPSIEDWRRIKNLGLGITGILAIGGLSLGAMLVAGIDTLKAVLRHWIGG